MEYGTPEFIAHVRDAFDHEFARSGDRLSATGAAVGAALVAMPGRDANLTVLAVREALGSRWDSAFVVEPPS